MYLYSCVTILISTHSPPLPAHIRAGGQVIEELRARLEDKVARGREHKELARRQAEGLRAAQERVAGLERRLAEAVGVLWVCLA